MRRRPDIVHFSGHGLPGGAIQLLADDGTPQPVPPEALAAFFRAPKVNVRVVVLNACHSDPQARALVKVVDCAIGMSDEIFDKAAIAFSGEFYQALGSGDSLQGAFDLGLAQLLGGGEAKAKSLARLHKRRGVDPARIHLLGDRPDPEAGPLAGNSGPGPGKLFLSYAHGEPDQALARALSDGLRGAGHEVFLDGTPENLSASGYFVPLLSSRSAHSEVVREESRLAHGRRNSHGRPLLLPVRVAYDGPLGYALGAWVNPHRWAEWRGPGDTEGVLRRILDVVGGRAAPPAPGEASAAGSAPSTDFRRPEPAADLSDMTAPGGAIRPNDPFYVERACDREVLAVARRLEETVVIKAPRQMGKSSLLKRYLAECRREGKKTALIDLSIFDDASLADYPVFLTALADELLDRFGLDGPSAIISQPAMNRFVRDRVLKAVPDNLVIALDEVDRILGRPYQADFFSMLRSWNEGRTDDGQPAWARLELALVISTEPYLLIDDAQRSPFNVRIPIVLDPFDADECRELNRRYGRVLGDDQAERLRCELLGGHPFLTRLAYYRLTRTDATGLDALMRDAARPDGPFGDHLRALLAKLRQSTRHDLLAALRQAIRHGTLPDELALDRLQAVGLVRRAGDGVAPANGLYARFFGAAS